MIMSTSASGVAGFPDNAGFSLPTARIKTLLGFYWQLHIHGATLELGLQELQAIHKTCRADHVTLTRIPRLVYTCDSFSIYLIHSCVSWAFIFSLGTYVRWKVGRMSMIHALNQHALHKSSSSTLLVCGRCFCSQPQHNFRSPFCKQVQLIDKLGTIFFPFCELSELHSKNSFQKVFQR